MTINEQATLTGFALSEDDISSALASSAVKNYTAGEPITVTNLNNLDFSTGSVPIPSSSAMSFSLSGTAKFVWTIDAKTLATQLAGKSKDNFAIILQGYPHISKANVSFFPLWRKSFPGVSAITIATSTTI